MKKSNLIAFKKKKDSKLNAKTKIKESSKASSKSEQKVTKKVVSKSASIISLSAYRNKNKKLPVAERNKIIEEHLPMIRFVARKISAKLPPHIDYEDLVSNGLIGLVDAIEKYDPKRNNKFKTYAEFRVRGAILDALRSQDWIPRSIRDKAKKIEKAKQVLEQKYSRAPEEKEIAEELNVSLESYHGLVTKTSKVSLISINDIAFFNKNDKNSILKILENENSSLNIINKKSIRRVIAKAIQELPEKQRVVLSLYYYEEYNLRKIGKILNVTESRVSQLHSKAIEKLKLKLSAQIESEELEVA